MPDASSPADNALPPEQKNIPARGGVAFQSRDFRLYQLARLVVILGAEAQAVAVAWQVYQLTHRAIDLGYTGLALFLPGPLFLLASGHVADRFDRRYVILVCYSLQCICTLVLLWFALAGVGSVWWIYAALFVVGTGRSFSAPASAALMTQLVPEKHFVNAVNWGAAVFQMANVAGPAIGGILFTLPSTIAFLTVHGMSFAGAPIVYIFTLATTLVFIALILAMHVRPGRMEHRAFSVDTVLAGLRYTVENKLLLGAISLDLFAVLLGGAVALMPIYADTILHAGPRGLGLLRAMPAIGALIVSFVLAWRPLRRRAGATMLVCVGIFGVSTVVFGLSRSIPLSLAALFFIGASDMVSVVVRSSLVQLATPPEMRGRVSAVSFLFIGASNEFGEFESGLTAQWWGAVRAVVVGGVGSMMVTGLWAVFFPSLRRVNELSADALQKLRPPVQNERP
jgi:MFS family permease